MSDSKCKTTPFFALKKLQREIRKFTNCNEIIKFRRGRYKTKKIYIII